MKLYVKFMNGNKIEINDISKETLIREIKQKIFENDSDKQVEKLKLVASGKMLKDEDTVESYEIKDDATIFCVISKNKPVEETVNNPPVTSIPVNDLPATQAPLPNPFVGGNSLGQMPNLGYGNMPNQAQMNAIMQNPDFMNMSMQMMNDPELGPLMMQVATNPTIMQDPNFMNQLLSNRRYMEIMMSNPMFQNMQGMMNQGGAQNQFSSLATQPPSVPAPSTAQPQWIPQPTQVPAPAPADAPTENVTTTSVDLYKEEMDQMVALGFPNRATNLQYLKICNGDVNRAINLLLDM